uniref:RNase H n=1 Tax=Pithovirus LCPAC404 TaxID=2506597 RepID=A0A481ZC19_9VIRU|nr:MAG: RNase H [Pithovirus LCPAC404]
MYKLFFDGCSKGNPGRSGAGAVIKKDEKTITAVNKYLGDKVTNNYAEYGALILGLKTALEMRIKQINVYGDIDVY